MTSPAATRWEPLPSTRTHLPRYAQVANELAGQIAAGRFPVGSRLPTEMELCRHYSISRHTVREALRRLDDAGLVSRRRRSGTEVIALEPSTAYVQPIGSIIDLLQYGEDTKLRVRSKARVAADASLARKLCCEEGHEWLRLETIRTRPEDGSPICLTTMYLNTDLAGIEDHLGKVSGTLSAMLESLYGLRILRIEQSIQAIRLSARQTKLLRVEPGSPALRAIRKYYDQADRLIEFADAVHPSERFTYVMHLRRH